ncbi:alpha/beta hydrolase [Streptomyces sp. NPDC059690]|uniref:alpha/beta hydrolase n=1 Tax=Streptomyces sp. NPDC059690 TaxID=3346907 RepID=UPI00367C0F63
MTLSVRFFAGRLRLHSLRHVTLLSLLALLITAGVSTAAAGNGGRPRVAPEARIVSVRMIDSRTQDLMVSSPAMKSVIPVRIILPKDWAKYPKANFPVLYMLHGGDDDYTSWTRETDIEKLAQSSNVLVVMPDAGKAGYYSDWHAGEPRWETFHTGELVRLVQRTYRASSSRAIIGLSMGGFGALNYAAHHQGMYRYAAAMSSYVDLNDPAVRIALALGSQRDGIDLRRVWGDPVKDSNVWQAHNPSAMPRAFRGTHVHLSSGDGVPGPLDLHRSYDQVLVGAAAEALLPKSMEKFASSLRFAGVQVTTHFYEPGTHAWPYWQRELHIIWPAVMRSLK